MTDVELTQSLSHVDEAALSDRRRTRRDPSLRTRFKPFSNWRLSSQSTHNRPHRNIHDVEDVLSSFEFDEEGKMHRSPARLYQMGLSSQI
ncbi:hypothetical protein KC363_g181 [Hortaea werneckii]|nr:hypothetical protein KC363_g181 [Hortaea werneckii]